MHTRSKVVVVVTLCSLFMSAWLLAEGPAKPLAEVAISASRVDWQPAGQHERLVLTVAGPDGLYFERVFGAGEAPFLSSVESALPDGVYSYELRAEGREVQWGNLWVKGGSFMDKVAAPSRPLKPAVSESKPPLKNVTAYTTVLADDFVVQGEACIGADCGAGDANGAVLKIKESGNYQLRFDGLNCCLPSEHIWTIQANDSTGPNGDFTIRDLTNGKIPFRILANAPDNALTIYTSSGNIGMGTLTPAVRLDVKANAAGLATERLQNSSATGFPGTEYLDNAGNVGLYFGLDNAASTTRFNSVNNKPIVILTNSTERMRITSAGSFGIGTSSPTYKFHLFENIDANTLSTVENSNAGTSAAAFLRAQSDVGTTQVGMHSSGRTIVRFGQTLGGRGEILHSGGNGLIMGTLEADSLILGTNNINRLQISGTGAVTVSGDLTVNGTFSNPSSLALKEEFKPLDPKTVLDRFVRLPIQEWSYKSDDRKLRHVGPTVEDFQASFGLGTEGQHIFPMDVQGVTMTAVQGLYNLVQEKDAEIVELRQRLADLEELVSKLATQ